MPRPRVKRQVTEPMDICAGEQWVEGSNRRRQTIGICAMIAAERLIQGSLLRHGNTLRIRTAIASPAENWRLTEGPSSSTIRIPSHHERR
jgi:hypothetical protein